MAKALNSIREFSAEFTAKERLGINPVSLNPIAFWKFLQKVHEQRDIAATDWSRLSPDHRNMLIEFASEVLNQDPFEGASVVRLVLGGILGIFTLQPFALPAFMAARKLSMEILERASRADIARAICSFAAIDNPIFQRALKTNPDTIDFDSTIPSSFERIRSRSVSDS